MRTLKTLCVLGLLLPAYALAQVVYPYFSPGGALSGTGTSQNVNVGAGTPFIAGQLPESNTALAVKPAVTVVATSNQTLSGLPTLDGQATAAGSVILNTAQTSGAENGPWVAAAGAWSRPTWYASGSTTQAFQFITTFVRLGTLYQGTTWRLTTANPITVDTTATTWVETPLALNATSLSGTLPAAQMPALTGDVTSTVGTVATSIAVNAVTNGQLAQMAASSVKCNTTAGTANAADCTVLQSQQLLATPSSTWAARGAGSYDGQLKFIVDSTASTVFAFGPAAFLVRWNAGTSLWTLVAPVEFKNNTQVNGTLVNTEQIIETMTIPVGLLQSARNMIVRLLYAKGGTTDTQSNGYTYIGTLGTTGDSRIQPFSSGQMTAAQRASAIEVWLAILNTTTVRLSAIQSGIGGWTGNSSAIYPRDITVADMSANVLKVSAAYTANGTTDLVGVGQFYILLTP